VIELLFHFLRRLQSLKEIFFFFAALLSSRRIDQFTLKVKEMKLGDKEVEGQEIKW